MNSISAVNSQNFKGEISLTKNGNKYYATNSGVKFMTGLATLNAIIDIAASRGNAVSSLPMNILKVGIGFGVGYYIDKKRNEHAAQATDYIKQVGAKRALMTDEKIKITDNRGLYYHSNDGRKYMTRIGAVLGAISGLASAFGVAVITKPLQLPKMAKAPAIILLTTVSTGLCALVGFIEGAIIDWLNNRSAKKHTQSL